MREQRNRHSGLVDEIVGALVRGRRLLFLVALVVVVAFTTAAIWAESWDGAVRVAPRAAASSTGPPIGGVADSARPEASLCGTPASAATSGPLVVSLPPAAPFTVGKISAAAWRHPPVADTSWQLNFAGFMYMLPIAARAQRDRSGGVLNALVAQVVSFHRQNPDVGSSVAGWDEGTAMRRLQAENCLYSLTNDRSLVPGMVADAGVQLGARYSGPPLFSVHNHGLMANLALLSAGRLLGTEHWVRRAADRLATESALAFSPLGVTFEQSSMYQSVNVFLWQRAAEELAALPDYGQAAAAVRAVLVRAERVHQWLTEPDGRLVQIGDSDRIAGSASVAAGRQPGRVFRDDSTGLAVGRWSWSSRATTYYTLRYGPPRRAHGHQDRGGLTWSARGTRVLVGVGRFGYDLRSSFAQWARSAASANVAVFDGGRLNEHAYVRADQLPGEVQTDRWQLTDQLYGPMHLRTIEVGAAAGSLRVADTFGPGSSFRQHWHLDPTWQLVAARIGGQSLSFRNADGQLLTVTSTGRLARLLHGGRQPIGGWQADVAGSPHPSYEIVLRSAGSTAVTTFVVS